MSGTSVIQFYGVHYVIIICGQVRPNMVADFSFKELQSSGPQVLQDTVWKRLKYVWKKLTCLTAKKHRRKWSVYQNKTAEITKNLAWIFEIKVFYICKMQCKYWDCLIAKSEKLDQYRGPKTVIETSRKILLAEAGLSPRVFKHRTWRKRSKKQKQVWRNEINQK